MKKIILVCTIMAMALAMAMPCFASSVALPEAPGGYDEYVVMRYSDGSGYMLFCITGEMSTSTGNFYYTGGAQIYELKGDVWQYLRSDPNGGYSVKDVIYDTSGVLGIVNSAVFASKVKYEEFAAILEQMKEQITVKNVVAVLAVGASAVVGLVFMWWGVRKLTRGVFSAFRKGKISV